MGWANTHSLIKPSSIRFFDVYSELLGVGLGGGVSGNLVDASGLVGRGVLVEPVLEVSELTVTRVVNASLVVLGVELESGVATDGDSLNFVGGGIELSNHEVIDGGDGIGELIPDGGELLAVSAPGGVELDKDILGGVVDDISEVLADEDGEVTLLLGDGLGLEVGDKLASLELINVGLESIDGDSGGITLIDELLEVFTRVDKTDGGELGLLDTDELGKSGLDALGDSGLDKENLTLEVGGSLLEGSLGSGASLFGEEDKGSLLLTEDGLNGVLGEGHESRLGLGIQEGDDGADIALTGVGNGRLIEVADDSSTGEGGTVGLSAGSVAGVEELVVLKSLGSRHESIEVLTLKATEVGEVAGVSGGLLPELVAGDLSGGGAGLLGDPLDNLVLGSSAVVVLSLTTTKSQKI